MFNKSQQLLKYGRRLGLVSLQRSHEVLRLFKKYFPNHDVAFLSDVRKGNVQMLVYPDLSSQEREQWSALRKEDMPDQDAA